MEMLGISLVTNLAAGITGEPLNHEEVLEAGRAAATRMGGLLADVASSANLSAMDLIERARDWISQDPDPVTRDELDALIDDGDTAAARPDRFVSASSSAPPGCAASSAPGPTG